MVKYKRILLKLSGEALLGADNYEIDIPTLSAADNRNQKII